MLLRPTCRIVQGYYASLTHAQVRIVSCEQMGCVQRQLGVPSLFLPSKRRDTDDAPDIILEVHAIAPPNPRSWFVGEEVIEGICAIEIPDLATETFTKMENWR